MFDYQGSKIASTGQNTFVGLSNGGFLNIAFQNLEDDVEAGNSVTDSGQAGGNSIDETDTVIAGSTVENNTVDENSENDVLPPPNDSSSGTENTNISESFSSSTEGSGSFGGGILIMLLTVVIVRIRRQVLYLHSITTALFVARSTRHSFTDSCFLAYFRSIVVH